jgi:hypothetical protein
MRRRELFINVLLPVAGSEIQECVLDGEQGPPVVLSASPPSTTPARRES